MKTNPKTLFYVLYGSVAYIVGLGTLTYLVAFLGNLQWYLPFLDPVVPKSVDTGPAASFWKALSVNVFLIALFGLQHSLMARQSFKRVWTRIIPEPIERSTYVIMAALVLILLYWQWRPMPEVIFTATSAWITAVLWGGFALGWLLVTLSSYMIDHFELFGIRQSFCPFLEKKFKRPPFQKPYAYKFMRHPMYLGFFVGIWFTPHMTVGHFILALGFTIYVFIGMQYEERDLIEFYQDQYREYKRQIHAFFPWKKH